MESSTTVDLSPDLIGFIFETLKFVLVNFVLWTIHGWF